MSLSSFVVFLSGDLILWSTIHLSVLGEWMGLKHCLAAGVCRWRAPVLQPTSTFLCEESYVWLVQFTQSYLCAVSASTRYEKWCCFVENKCAVDQALSSGVDVPKKTESLNGGFK